MGNANSVNARYGNAGNLINPVLENTINSLIALKLYGENLMVEAAPGLSKEEQAKVDNLLTFKSPAGEDVVALDVLVDCITRNILKSLQNGFTQNGLSKDAATNINISLPTLPNLNTGLVDNVHDAIWILCQEIATIKSAMNSNAPIGIVDPNTITNKLIFNDGE
jgi:hypothetical protein